MARKKKEENESIAAVLVVMILIIAFLSGYIGGILVAKKVLDTNGQPIQLSEETGDGNSLFISNNNTPTPEPAFELNSDPHNLSKEGFVKVYPSQKERKIMVLECVNSTLKIDDNKIYCEVM